MFIIYHHVRTLITSLVASGQWPNYPLLIEIRAQQPFSAPTMTEPLEEHWPRETRAFFGWSPTWSPFLLEDENERSGEFVETKRNVPILWEPLVQNSCGHREFRSWGTDMQPCVPMLG